MVLDEQELKRLVVNLINIPYRPCAEGWAVIREIRQALNMSEQLRDKQYRRQYEMLLNKFGELARKRCCEQLPIGRIVKMSDLNTSAYFRGEVIGYSKNYMAKIRLKNGRIKVVNPMTADGRLRAVYMRTMPTDKDFKKRDKKYQENCPSCDQEGQSTTN